jgi:hypothetical protein
MFLNKKLIIILLLSLISSLFLLAFMNIVSKNIRFEDFALAGKTITIYEKYNNININSTTYELNSSQIKEVKNKYKSTIISFGNSQSHSINNYQNGKDHLFSYYLNKYNQDKIVLNLSAPNGSLQEMFLSLVNAQQDLKENLNIVMFSLVFDDTREDGIRKVMNDLIKNNKNILKQYITGQSILVEYNKIGLENKKIKKELLLKESMEQNLNRYIENIFESYKNRGEIRAYFYGQLYFIRNYVLGITPSTKRKRIDRIYKKNIQAFKDIIKFCELNNILPIFYIAPIRQDIEIPYVKEEYSQFKNDLKYIHNIYDLDTVVPAKYWGVTNGDWVDFMHFKGAGHKILAKELQNILLKENTNGF